MRPIQSTKTAMAKDKSARARLVLVRHGEIRANVEQVWHGSTDSELTAVGREQARLVGEHLATRRGNVAAVYASPLRRARETAAPIAGALGLEPAFDAGLAEYGIGELEGASYAALLSEHRFFERIHADADYAPPGGESARAVCERASGSLVRIAGWHPGEQVVIVSHGAALALALAALLESDPQAWRSYHVSNCSVSELVLEPEPVLLSFDQTGHLEG